MRLRPDIAEAAHTKPATGAGFTDVFFAVIGVTILGFGLKSAYAVRNIHIDDAGGVHDRSQYHTPTGGMQAMQMG